jgi:ribosomal protein S18 acetylase RimI-like enzyme
VSGSPADPPSIRDARTTDARGIAAVHVASWRAAYAGQLPDRFLRKLSVEERTRSWRSRIAAKRVDECVLVAVRGDTIVGFASGGPTRDKEDDQHRVGEIYAVYLLPEEWGQGGGRDLLAHATRALTAAGFEDASLWVLETNRRARGFYEHEGWWHDGATKQERFGERVTEVRYRLPLAVRSTG